MEEVLAHARVPVTHGDPSCGASREISATLRTLSVSFGLWALESLKGLRDSRSTADQNAVSALMSTQFRDTQVDVQQGTHLSSWDGISLNVENFAL